MKASTLEMIEGELRKARDKFPKTRHVMNALTEEVGELAQALLDQEYEQGKGRDDLLNEQVRKEAVQVAAMAIRILEEGDTTFPLFDPDWSE